MVEDYLDDCVNRTSRQCIGNPCRVGCPGYRSQFDRVSQSEPIRKYDGTAKAPVKPDKGPMPHALWIEDRIIKVCKCIADAKNWHPEWIDELDKLIKMRKAVR